MGEKGAACGYQASGLLRAHMLKPGDKSSPAVYTSGTFQEYTHKHTQDCRKGKTPVDIRVNP